MPTILPYSDQYKQQVIDLILNIWENEFDYKNIERPDIYDIINHYQKDEDSNFWVAIVDDQVVGTIGLKNRGNNQGQIKRLAVAKKMRQQGIGEKLLNTVVAFTETKGYKEIYAGMVPENIVAINFYKNHGFQKSEIVPKNITAATDSIWLKLMLI